LEKERLEKVRLENLRKQAEREAQRQKDLQAMMGGADAEISGIRAREAAAARARGLAAYQAKIRNKIKGNIVLPPGISGNPKAVFKVTQLPTGDIVGDVRISQSSGNRALDEAIVRAILKSSPLPLPDERSLFERDLNIPYQPYDE
jgi:colicin import membrane protein